MTRTPQDKGRRFEHEWADRIGGAVVLASGALWFDKLDVRGLSFRWSCKHTMHKSYRLSQSDIDEAVNATSAPGGDGRSLPAMVIRVGSPRYDMVVLRADDFLALVEGREDRDGPRPPRVVGGQRGRKSDERHRAARVPSLLRKESHEDDPDGSFGDDAGGDPRGDGGVRTPPGSPGGSPA